MTTATAAAAAEGVQGRGGPRGRAAGVRFRDCVPGDVGAVVGVVNRAYREPGHWTGEHGLVAGPRVREADVEATLRKGADEVRLLVAELDGRVVGTVEVALVLEEDGDGGTRREGYIGMLSVEAELGSLGLGRALVEQAEAVAASHFRCTVATMWTLGARSDIIAWYTSASMGYADTGERREAKQLIGSLGGQLLVDCDFVVLRKPLPVST